MDEMQAAEEYKWVLWIGSTPIYGNDCRYMLRQAKVYGLVIKAVWSTRAYLQD